MANLREIGKLKMEQEYIEEELSILYERTLKLEDELNSIIVEA